MTDGSGNEKRIRFAEVFNDRIKYPSAADVAEALGLSRKTVWNFAGLMRYWRLKDKSVPELIVRRGPDAKPAPAKKTEQEHAQERADGLTGQMLGLFGASRYPVINPEAMTVRPTKVLRYDKVTGGNTVMQGTPKTWLSDTLRVARVPDARNRRYLFTGAQNDALVHEGFWENLLAFALAIEAEIVVGPWTYETNWWDENSASSRVYSDLIKDYLCFGQMEIGDEFMFCGEMNALPTATRPISDLTAYSRGKWAVYPHASVQMLSVPNIDPTKSAFQIMTTGAVTLPQVIPRKMGIKAIEKHVLGATLVEFDEEGDLFCRQIIATKDGAFQDLDMQVANGQVSTGHSVRALTVADIHIAKLNRKNALATLGYDYTTGDTQDGSILEELKPDYLILHDLHDHEARNHHMKDDQGHNYEMAIRDRDNVFAEIARASKLVVDLAPRCKTIVVVESNHDLALERYVKEARYRNDGANFKFGLLMDLALAEAIEIRSRAIDSEVSYAPFSLLEWAMRQQRGAEMGHVVWAYDSTSFMVDEVQVGFHGFRGTNGAKGTVAGFARLGRDITIGDKHSPSILNGVYGAGVMQLQHGYNKGPSGWATSHVVQYPNGKRSIITLRGGKWRANPSRSALT